MTASPLSRSSAAGRNSNIRCRTKTAQAGGLPLWAQDRRVKGQRHEQRKNTCGDRGRWTGSTIVNDNNKHDVAGGERGLPDGAAGPLGAGGHLLGAGRRPFAMLAVIALVTTTGMLSPPAGKAQERVVALSG